MSEQKSQGAATPVIETPQGAAKPVIAETPTTTPQGGMTPTNIPNSEWQQTQERLARAEKELADARLQKFENENPIVKLDKYKDKWAEKLKQQSDPNSRYHKLSHEEILCLIREPEVVTPNPPAPQSVSVPSLNPSVSPDMPAGKTDQTARKWLKMRGYTDAQIDATESAA